MTVEEIVRNRLGVSPEQIADFCRRWRIKELSLFGSALRDDFRDDSDVDVLVVFDAGETWDLWDIRTMEDELKKLFGRNVDVVEKKAVTNPFRRHEILTTRRVLYAA